MSEQAESGGGYWKIPQGPDATGSFRKQIGILQKSKEEIQRNLHALHEAKLTLDFLEESVVETPVSGPFESLETAQDGGPSETIRLAAYLFSIARTCRDMVEDERFNKFLLTATYTQEDTTALLTAFDSLADVWSTYKKLIEKLDFATWDREPTFDRIWSALEKPRRRYIDALSAYYVQLSVVLNKLRRSPDTTPRP